MSNRAKAVTLVLAAVAPWLCVAQTGPAKPSPQQRAQAAPPANVAAPASQPAPADSRRFVTNQNFYRAGSATQPVSSPANATPTRTPVASPVAGVNRINNALPVPQQPVVASVPQPVPASLPIQPAVNPASVVTEPAVRAAVDYASGQLTVVAERAPLGQVLKLIAGKTGAVIDLAPELQQEPVMAKLGPSPVREVLTALLDSPRVDYLIFGSGDEPGSLQRIVVRRRQSFGNNPMASFRAQPQQQQQIPGVEPDASGQIISQGTVPAPNEATQDQRMEEWKKQRAQMLEAEMKKSAQERENEKYQPQDPPTPQETPQQQDNPPQ